MGSYYRPLWLQIENSTGKGFTLTVLSLMHLFRMLFLNWKQFSAKGCFTVSFSALVAGRGVSKPHIYIPLHCLWAQSSKEMHNAGRLMTWNGPHESILIKWSTKDLPWKESPSRNEPAPNLYPGHSEEPEHWVGSAGSCQCRENLIPLCTTLLKSGASLASLHLSFHPHISLS